MRIDASERKIAANGEKTDASDADVSVKTILIKRTNTTELGHELDHIDHPYAQSTENDFNWTN